MNQPGFDYDRRGRLIVCSEENEVIGHDGGDERPLWLFRAEEPVVGVAAAGPAVAVALRTGAVVSLGPGSGQELSRRQLDDEVLGLAASPSGDLAVLAVHGVSLLWPDGRSQLLTRSRACCAAFAFDGGRLALGQEDGLVRVLDLAGAAPVGEHRLEGPVADLSAGPDGCWLAATGDQIRRVEAEGNSSERLTGLGGSRITGVLARDDSSLFGLIIDRRQVVLLHYPSLETVANFEYLDRQVQNLAFGPHPWVGIGLFGGDGNKVNLVSGAVHRTDTHPEREHHSWALSQSIDQQLAARLLLDDRPAPRPIPPTPAADSSAGVAAPARPWRRFPRWYLAVWALIGVLYLVVTLIYRLGGSGIEAQGASTSFERGHDKTLFKIDARRGFLVGSRGDLSVVHYRSGAFPLRPLCGSCALDGIILNLAGYRKGDWVYSGYPQFGGPAAVNLKSGEVVRTERRAHPLGAKVDPAQFAAYASRGLSFDASLRLTPARVAAHHQQLAFINESCLVYTAAFLLVAGVWVLVGVPLAVRRRPRAT